MARRLPPTRYAQSAGAKIAFQISGEGRCDLVFVPGLVSHLELQWQQLGYRRFVTALERACRVIRFDKRGTGLSDPTGAMPSMDQRASGLVASLSDQGWLDLVHSTYYVPVSAASSASLAQPSVW